MIKKSPGSEVSYAPVKQNPQNFFIRSDEMEAALILAVHEEERSEAIVLLKACRSLCDKLARVGYEEIELDNNDLTALKGYQEVVLTGLTGDPEVVYHSGNSALDMVRLAQLLARFLAALREQGLKSL